MSAVERAGGFFRNNGRDVDKAQFEYHFKGAPLERLLGVLGRYQQPDGGFGHGLEPDIAAPDSNPFATEIALLICLQADVPRGHPLLADAVRYLEETQDEHGGWHFSPGIYQHRLAPWFTGWEWPNLNPACTIGGLLRELGLGSNRLHEGIEGLFDRLAQPKDLLGTNYYAVRPYGWYFLPEWDHPRRELYISGVLWWILRQHPQGVGLPFDLVRSPDTYTGRLLPESIVEEGLDAIERAQAEDGGWPTEYAPHWRGWATVQELLVLREFGRA
ncbi:MAG: hypothetical protein M3P51_16045 [Chloroflexota bacterium]|nr:hypothetical protein [Chloroflexota bacterium]